jgi:hypothetical protein
VRETQALQGIIGNCKHARAASLAKCSPGVRGIDVVSSNAVTVADYLASLPPERRVIVGALRKLIRAHLPKGYVEAMRYGMICYEIPLSRYPDTYNRQPLSYVAVAAQKNNYSLYLTCAYLDEERARRLRDAHARAGKKLDMGKSCVRFKSLDALELDAIAAEIASTTPAQFIGRYELSRSRKAT